MEPAPPKESPFSNPVDAAAFEFRETAALSEQVGHLREAKDRSWIARTVIWIFTGTIAVAEIVFLVQGIETHAWDDVARQTSDLIRSAVLPIVTLILGYYFGRSGRI